MRDGMGSMQADAWVMRERCGAPRIGVRRCRQRVGQVRGTYGDHTGGWESLPPQRVPCLASRRTTMESVLTQPCLRAHDHAVLATEWRDGRLHMSPVTVGLDAAGRAISSSRATASTVQHLPCDPRAAFCVFVE